LDNAKFDAETNEAALISAKAALEVQQFARTSLAARLIDPTTLARRQTQPVSCKFVHRRPAVS
jgi:HlyD family secretion protein